MSKIVELENLKEILDGVETYSGYKLIADYIDISEETYLKIEAKDYERFPIIARIEKLEENKEAARIIFQINLFNKQDLNKRQRDEMNEEFLTANSIIDLSSISISNGTYIIFGELSANSKEEDILVEVDTLLNNLMNVLDNVLERIKSLGDYDPEFLE